LAIVISVLAFLVAAGLTGILDGKTVIALLGGGAVVAGIGFADDVRAVSARVRLLLHFLAAGWAVFWLGGLPTLDLGSTTIPLGVAGTILAIIGIVWATNLFNFMDGIDGIAGVEAVSLGVIGGALLLVRSQIGFASISFVVAAAALGFLRWNWSPARIFMGDVGSGFLGFVFGVLSVATETSGALPFLVWMILFAAFLVDATITVIRRIPSGEWGKPHKSHAYQRAVQAGLPHGRVSGYLSVLNLFLGGIAFSVVENPGAMRPLALLALTVCCLLYAAIERLRPID